MPEYEFYEPKMGRQFGFVENEALFPSEVDLDKTIYFRKSKAPPSAYKGYKYVPLFYHYSKNLRAKTLEGNPIFVAHYVLVPQTFDEEIQNYMQLPVYNPIAETEVMVTVERTLREYQQVKPIIEMTIHKDPNGLSTPQLKDPMLKPINLKVSKKTNNTKTMTQKVPKIVSTKKDTTHAQQKLISKKLPVLPINKKTGRPYTPAEWKKELLRRKAEEQIRLQKERAFLERIDFGLIFPAPQAARIPSSKSKKRIGTGGNKLEASSKSGTLNRRPPPNKLRVVRSVQEEKKIGNGGFTKGPNTPTTNYFQNKTVVSSSLKSSPYYPPFNMEMPSVPGDAVTDPAEIGHALIARYIPPKPLIRGMKYTFFFLAPAKFKFPKDIRVYVPVYILIPRTETRRPSDMIDCLFDHFVTGNDQFSEDLLMVDPESKIMHTIISTVPRKISLNSHEVLKSKFYLETPMKVMSRNNFLSKDEFKHFLEKEKLLNPPDAYFQAKKPHPENLIGDSNAIIEYLKKLFYFKDPNREQIIKDAVAAAKIEAKKRYDNDNEAKLRLNRTEFDRGLREATDEEKALTYQEMLAKHELDALRHILKQTNPNSTWLKQPKRSKMNPSLTSTKTRAQQHPQKETLTSTNKQTKGGK